MSANPIPVVQIHPADDGASSAGHTHNTDDGKTHRLSASKLKEKLETLGDNLGRESPHKMGDRMVNLYVQATFFY